MTESAAVTDNATAHRYELRVDGEVAGYVDYHDNGTRRSMNHTEVEPEYEGHGVGSTLAKAALDDAREHGLSVLPYCPFIRSYIDGHRDSYVDLVPESERAKFKLA